MKTLLLALMVASAACANGVEDDLAGESQTDGSVDGKADGAADGVYTYFSVTVDLRKCAAPMCGGFNLARLNRSTTVCANGTASDHCYVPTLDWSEANLTEASQQKLIDAANVVYGVHAIVRGRFASKSYTGYGNLGRFVVTEAWLAETDSDADGVFAKVTPSGIQCITTPCPTMKEHSLNNSYTANIGGIDWSYAGLSSHQIQAFNDEINTDHGTIIAGNRYQLSHSVKGRTATAAFHRLVNEAPCFRGGCSDEICSDHEGVISTCIWRPEYACYQAATCERQSDGQCGFTQDEAYDTCMSNL